MWEKFVRDYLSFTRDQRRGLFVLGCIIVLCLILSLALPYLFPYQEQEDKEFQKAVAVFLSQQKEDSISMKTQLFAFDPNTLPEEDWLRLGVSKKTVLTIQHYLDAGGSFKKKEDLQKVYGLSQKEYERLFPYIRIVQKREKQKQNTQKTEIKLFYFDPNQLSLEDWIELGISKRVAQTIRNYLTAGGHFYKKEDLKDIYGFSQKDYQRLAPYVQIEKKEKKSLRKGSKFYTKKDRAKTYEDFKIDINQADSLTWSKLRGIGPVFSSRIVRFRKALGGFYKINQLTEVYGLSDSLFQTIKPHLQMSKTSLQQLEVNTATFDELKAHPYIHYSLAKAIIAFRKQHGAFDSLSSLKEIQLINNEIYKKLLPYLTLQK